MRSVQLTAALGLALLLPATAIGEPARVSFNGCPIPELPRGCLLVRSGHRLYDISSATPPIRTPRLGIRGTGVRGGQGLCKRGTVLTDIRYTVTGSTCEHSGTHIQRQ